MIPRFEVRLAVERVDPDLASTTLVEVMVETDRVDLRVLAAVHEAAAAAFAEHPAARP